MYKVDCATMDQQTDVMLIANATMLAHKRDENFLKWSSLMSLMSKVTFYFYVVFDV